MSNPWPSRGTTLNSNWCLLIIKMVTPQMTLIIGIRNAGMWRCADEIVYVKRRYIGLPGIQIFIKLIMFGILSVAMCNSRIPMCKIVANWTTPCTRNGTDYLGVIFNVSYSQCGGGFVLLSWAARVNPILTLCTGLGVRTMIVTGLVNVTRPYKW